MHQPARVKWLRSRPATKKPRQSRQTLMSGTRHAANRCDRPFIACHTPLCLLCFNSSPASGACFHLSSISLKFQRPAWRGVARPVHRQFYNVLVNIMLLCFFVFFFCFMAVGVPKTHAVFERHTFRSGREVWPCSTFLWQAIVEPFGLLLFYRMFSVASSCLSFSQVFAASWCWWREETYEYLLCSVRLGLGE